MEWKSWNDKNVFVKLRTGAVYSGRIIDVDISSNELIWITLIDKNGERVTFVHSEILKMKEEGEDDLHKIL